MKVVNFVLGLAAAIILSALIVLGIHAFYPEPTAPAYSAYPTIASTPCTSGDAKCEAQQSAYNQQQQAYEAQQQQQEQTYQDQMNVYNRNLFIIANIIGIIVFAIGFWLVFGVALASQAVPVGIILAGLWSIMYGYARGWGSVDDQLKFFIGLVIAVLVVGGGMWLVQRYQKKQSTKA